MWRQYLNSAFNKTSSLQLEAHYHNTHVLLALVVMKVVSLFLDELYT